MDLLSMCDEVLQLIIYELNDPSSLSLVCKRLHNLTRDPYVRAHYFLARYGNTQAIYHALGRGKLLNPRVIDILISSGAHLSRYLIQVAVHHYFYTTSHFVKSPWVRSVPLEVFTYFLKLASERYDEIPRGKGDDDGSIFLSFIKESRFPSHLRHISWETIRDILDKYHFIPFSTKDPIMVQFPLALALEPRLLPYAVANGFYMDSKYRDFVFRKIFERPSSADRGVEDIVQNVKELCRLDKTMFVSRTVAAEVCMEAKANDIGYTALKQLDKSGDLLFDLGTVVEDLLKLFLTNRSSHNSQILRQLFTDFPSTDPAVRIVLLMTVFTNPEGGHVSLNTVKTRLESLKLGPITRLDICNVFINPYLEKYGALVEYLRTEIQTGDDGEKGMKSAEIRAVIEDVATRCLELECKGKMLKKLHDNYSNVHQAIVRAVLTKHRIDLEDLPPAEDVDACARYRPKLCRNYFLKPCEESDYFWDGRSEDGKAQENDDCMAVDSDEEDGGDHDPRFLGHIGQESLTTMIRQDELMPIRARRRSIWSLGSYMQTLNVSQLPYDSLPVGRWIKDQFGPESCITAVFMTHAVLNNHSSILRYYLSDHHSVPITLKHFQLLAHLGRAPNFFLYSNIQAGAKFYRDEEEYISSTDSARALFHSIKVKTEVSQPTVPPEPQRAQPRPSSPSTPRKKKRPRRSAATSVPSYVVPDSDDEAIAVEDDYDYDDLCQRKKKYTMDHLQLWIKHLGELLKVEQAKHRAKKKRMESEVNPNVKLRVPKNEFLKSLSSNLRILRKQDEAKRMIYQADSGDEYTGTSDDDYSRRTRTKRRRTTRG